MMNRLQDRLRREDPDRFFLSLFAPPAVQADIWAVLAFNLEIARTRELVTQTTLGLIRLQWWHGEIKTLFAGDQDFVPSGDILPPLAAAIARHGLPYEAFETLLYAREFDLEDVAPSSLEGLAHYARATNAPLLSLMGMIGAQEESRETWDNLAAAWGITGLIRAFPVHKRQGRCFLPSDLCPAPFSEETDLRPVIESMAEKAAVFLHAAHPRRPLGRACAASVALSLRHIRKSGHDPFAPAFQKSPPFREFRIWMHTVGGTFFVHMSTTRKDVR